MIHQNSDELDRAVVSLMTFGSAVVHIAHTGKCEYCGTAHEGWSNTPVCHYHKTLTTDTPKSVFFSTPLGEPWDGAK